MLLWEEYKERHPEGYQHSRFCAYYRPYAQGLDLPMRQVHGAGEKCFVDYAGQTIAVCDRPTGELRQAQIFNAVLGASNFTYCEAVEPAPPRLGRLPCAGFCLLQGCAAASRAR